MKQEKIWLSSPHMGGEEHRFVQEAFDTNWIAPLGPHVTGFEQDIENYLGGEKKVAVLSSGTAALHLSLVMLGVTDGDEVICQSFTFCGSANPITYTGAKPVFVDSEKDTWNICPEHLEEAILDRKRFTGQYPKAIMAVHLYGMPYKVDEVQSIADRYDIPIIEDAAEALGSKYRGRYCGTFGHYSALSFNGNKIITTSGGGALVTITNTDKERCVYLATQARQPAPHYEHTEVGYNYRLSNVAAGIGRGQMMVLDDHVMLRRGMNSFYSDLFDGIEGIRVHSEPTDEYYSNHWLSCIIIDEHKCSVNRDELFSAFAKANIETRPLWKPMHLQPVFKHLPYYGEKIAERLFATGLCLPSGSNLTNNHRSQISVVIKNLLQSK